MGEQLTDPALHVGRRVLVVDDEITIRTALVRFFVKSGSQVTEAEDGAQALEAIFAEDAEPFDVIVCDLRMPGVSGIEVYERVERERPELLTRFIFSSGDVVSEEVHGFLERVLCPVLQKPFHLARLREEVERVSPRP